MKEAGNMKRMGYTRRNKEKKGHRETKGRVKGMKEEGNMKSKR